MFFSYVDIKRADYYDIKCPMIKKNSPSGLFTLEMLTFKFPTRSNGGSYVEVTAVQNRIKYCIGLGLVCGGEHVLSPTMHVACILVQ